MSYLQRFRVPPGTKLKPKDIAPAFKERHESHGQRHANIVAPVWDARTRAAFRRRVATASRSGGMMQPELNRGEGMLRALKTLGFQRLEKCQ